VHDQASPVGITFAENVDVDAGQLNALYRLVGWDRSNRRTGEETRRMLELSHYYIAARTAQGAVIGYARVCGDPYVAQVLDVITHPDHRRRGVATQCMRGVIAYLRRSQYVSVTLTHDKSLDAFYQALGFQTGKDVLRAWKPGTVEGA
jgi:ribosomal protein S18 acetylase RimI-like enzyme